MDTAAYAQELARRLTQADAGAFRAVGDTVLLEGVAEGEGVLQVVSAGSGRTEQVMQALRRAGVMPTLPVIVGRRFSQNALAELNRADANYMDDRLLRIRLHAPAMLIRLQNEAAPPAEAPEKALRLSGTAGGVALALLQDPAREWKVADLATEGHASLGAAQNTVVALEAAGLLERTGAGPATRRRVIDAGALLDRYAHDAVADRKVVARGFILNNGALDTMREVSRRLAGEAGLQAWFTGVAAAQMVAPHVTAIRKFEVWVTAPHSADFILSALGAMPADDGANLVVMRGRSAVTVGAQFSNGVYRTSIFRMYVDALADPARGEEQAEHLRETVIGF